MRWRVRPESDQPIYEQIVDQAVAAVAEDNLAAGARMPSVREMAETLLVNPNTVARAYQELERLGLVVSRRGVGMEITAAAPEACKTRRLERASSALRVALEEAFAAGMARTDIDAVLDHISKSPSPMRRNTDGHRGRRSSTG
ncbi:MAG TPA: GntR family transcriptional regulator [Gemmataceae bacterium]|jgi:GntR family transcriptional regulator|nr:GntR family transcriptional regulator [Gemmataceae bacterium]